MKIIEELKQVVELADLTQISEVRMKLIVEGLREFDAEHIMKLMMLWEEEKKSRAKTSWSFKGVFQKIFGLLIVVVMLL
jgi:hypothetical protein